MTFSVSVDIPRWQAHLDAVVAREPGIVPVVKGHGYGLGTALLAEQATRLGVDTVAAGTPAEARRVLETFGGTVVVLEPWTPATPAPSPAQVPRTVRTIGSVVSLEAALDAAEQGSRAPFVVELDSSMQRHGLSAAELAWLRHRLLPLTGTPGTPGVLRGFAVHLPVCGGRRGELHAVARQLAGAGWATTLWVSHAGAAQLAAVQAAVPTVRLRERVGTRLWLGDRGALEASGRVLDVRHVAPGARLGSARWRARTRTVVVVSGGTAHGVGLHAEPAVGLRHQLVGVARGVAALVGVRPSPFVLGGHRLRFVDTPHMQVSMLALPPGVPEPQVGDAVPCQVRMTTSSFDAVVPLGGSILPGQRSYLPPPTPPLGIPPLR